MPGGIFFRMLGAFFIAMLKKGLKRFLILPESSKIWPSRVIGSKSSMPGGIVGPGGGVCAPDSGVFGCEGVGFGVGEAAAGRLGAGLGTSHVRISYAVF